MDDLAVTIAYQVATRFDPARLRRALLMRGLSEAAAARAAGLHRGTVRRALAGREVMPASAAAILVMLERVAPRVTGDPGDLLRPEDDSGS